MKKVTLLAVVLTVINFGLLKAQTSQGKLLVGVSTTLGLAGTGSDLMSIGYSSVKEKSDEAGFEEANPDKMTSFTLVPKIGYFIIDNLAVGLDLVISSTSTKDGVNSDKFSQTLLSAGPFVRYYIPTEKVMPFFELSGSFGTVNNKADFSDNSIIEDQEFKTSVGSIGGGVGMAAPLGDRVLFDVLVGYSSLTIKDKDNNNNNERSVLNTLGLKLGFTFLLGGN